MCTQRICIPVTTKYGSSYNSVLVPCGVCPSCLKSKQMSWIPRLFYEMKGKRTFFVTFTYRNDTVHKVLDEKTGEIFFSLHKKDIQLLFKRARMHFQRLSKYQKFSYFLCGEYGTNTKRPHYHCLFFGISEDMLNFITSEWQKHFGFVLSIQVDTLHQKSLFNTAKYLTKYSMKGIYEHEEFQFSYYFIDTPLGRKRIRVPPIVEPAFRVMSKGIGLSYLNKHTISYHMADDMQFDDLDSMATEIFKRKNIQLNDEKNSIIFPLGRYYSEKIFGKSPLLQDSIFRSYLDYSEQLRNNQLSQLSMYKRTSTKSGILSIQQNTSEQISTKSDDIKLKQWYSKSKF